MANISSGALLLASQLNDIRTKLLDSTNGLPKKNITPNITLTVPSVGTTALASDMTTFLSNIASLQTQTFLKHADWSAFPIPTNITTGQVIRSDLYNQVDNLSTHLLTLNGNYSVAQICANTPNNVCNKTNVGGFNEVNAGGNNQTNIGGFNEVNAGGNSQTNIGGFNQVNAGGFNEVDAGGFNVRGLGNTVRTSQGFSQSVSSGDNVFTGNYNVGNHVCSDCSGNFSTFTAFDTCTTARDTNKGANQGIGFSNDRNFSGFATQENCTKCSNRSNSNFSDRSDANYGDVSFSQTTYTNFSPNTAYTNFSPNQTYTNFSPNRANTNFSPNTTYTNFSPNRTNTNFSPDITYTNFGETYRTTFSLSFDTYRTDFSVRVSGVISNNNITTTGKEDQ